MTPERLQEIRDHIRERYWDATPLDMVHDLLDYIDLLHEDLRLTRAERDAEKKKNMKLRKDTK